MDGGLVFFDACLASPRSFVPIAAFANLDGIYRADTCTIHTVGAVCLTWHGVHLAHPLTQAAVVTFR